MCSAYYVLGPYNKVRRRQENVIKKIKRERKHIYKTVPYLWKKKEKKKSPPEPQEGCVAHFPVGDRISADTTASSSGKPTWGWAPAHAPNRRSQLPRTGCPRGGGGQQSLPTSERLRQLQQRRKSPFSARFAEDNCISREACKSPERPRPGARRRPDGAAAARARVSPGSPAAAGAHAPARGPRAPRHPGINSF